MIIDSCPDSRLATAYLAGPGHEERGWHFHRALALVFAGFALLQTSKATVASVPARPTVVLQRVGVPGTAREMGMGLAEFPPNAVKSWHSPTGPEVCYVLDGSVTLRAKGLPARTFYSGESFRIPANLIHSTTAGPEGAKVIAAWVHLPGKQFNIPADVPIPHL